MSNKEDVNLYLNNRDKIAEKVVKGIIDDFHLESSNGWTGYSAGTWYYIGSGVVNWNYTGIIMQEGVGYYVERGTVVKI